MSSLQVCSHQLWLRAADNASSRHAQDFLAHASAAGEHRGPRPALRYRAPQVNVPKSGLCLCMRWCWRLRTLLRTSMPRSFLMFTMSDDPLRMQATARLVASQPGYAQLIHLPNVHSLPGTRSGAHQFAHLDDRLHIRRRMVGHRCGRPVERICGRCAQCTSCMKIVHMYPYICLSHGIYAVREAKVLSCQKRKPGWSTCSEGCRRVWAWSHQLALTQQHSSLASATAYALVLPPG